MEKKSVKRNVLIGLAVAFSSCMVCGVVGQLVAPPADGEEGQSTLAKQADQSTGSSQEERWEEYQQELLNRFPGPDEQRLFIRQHQIRFNVWKKEDNQLRKAEVVQSAEKWSEQFWSKRNNRVEGWKGVVQRISGGAEDASVIIGADDGRRIGAYQMEFRAGLSLLRLSDGIPADSQAYQALRDLERGDCVVFSGEIQPKLRGHLRSPDYTLQRLDEIRACD
ncbi:hypothetical protein [Lujinxingia litoralis]|uniref:hypothetical protein n=1 Tax=Lujinxingia litoralis TaxID=2211119 RepID=UPI0011B94392|nr:hypothetical protein [Lujinxingia litoralis]